MVMLYIYISLMHLQKAQPSCVCFEVLSGSSSTLSVSLLRQTGLFHEM